MTSLTPARLGLLGSFILVSNAAFGASIIVNCTTSGIPTLTSGSPSATSAVTCGQFNGALGTLTQYTILNGAGAPLTIPSGSITIQNPTSSALSGAAGVIEEWQLSTFAGFVAGKVGTDLVSAINLGPNATGTFIVTPPSAIALTSGPLSSGLASLIGIGTFHIADVAVTIRLDLSTAGTVQSYSVNGPVDGISVVYSFNNTPEPSTLSLAGAGALLLALRRARRAMGGMIDPAGDSTAA